MIRLIRWYLKPAPWEVHRAREAHFARGMERYERQALRRWNAKAATIAALLLILIGECMFFYALQR